MVLKDFHMKPSPEISDAAKSFIEALRTRPTASTYSRNSFDFAHDVLYLNKSNDVSFSGFQTRDDIFASVLSEFGPKPIRICQVGAIETFVYDWRIGSGWSDLIFGEHIKQYGGELTIIDTNLDNLANSVLAATKLQYDINAVYGNAIDHIDNTYDVYYLDGSNDPQETLDQFNKVKDTDSIVLIDDYFIKGSLIEAENYDIITHKIFNGVGVSDVRAP